MPLTLNLQSFQLPNGDNLIVRLSAAADGAQGNGPSYTPTFSADGRYVLFTSGASNLVAGDTNNGLDVFRRDLVTGETVRISTAADGTQANGQSNYAQMSANGRYVVFESNANNLVSGDVGNIQDIFRKDLVTGEIVRASLGTDGTQANNGSYNPQLSADGRYVVFESYASNLVVGDTNNSIDIFRKDLVTGEIVRVSAATDGSEGNSDSYDAQISADGRYVLFTSTADNLVTGDTLGAADIFRKDLTTGEVVRVSIAADGSEGKGDSLNPQFSADGRYVLFESYAGNLVVGDTNERRDIFRKDLVTGEIVRLSIGADGTQANDNCYNAQLSADGRYMVFVSVANNLVAGDTNNSPDVFRKDLQTGEIVRLSTAAVAAQGNEQGNSSSGGAHVSSDGRYVVFESAASNLVAGDTNSARDIFRKDLVTGEIVRVSAGADGTQANNHSSNEKVSADGRYVVFSSQASNLVAGDTNNAGDIFRKDLVTGEIVRVSAGTDGAQANNASYNPQLSTDGRYVVFESTADNLVAGDTNNTTDIFRKDLQTGEIVRVSLATDGTQANFSSALAQVSADGRYVVFESYANNLVAGDTNNTADIFRADLLTGDTVRVSTAANGAQANNGSNNAQMSADGRYVVFSGSASNLVAGDTNNATDIFRKDLLTGDIMRVSTASDNAQANSYSGKAQISADGHYVVFESYANNLVAGDTNNYIDVFRKDLATGEVVLVSTAANGDQGNNSSRSAQVSADGRYVVFESAANNLVAGDTNGAVDVFRKDLQTGEIVRISAANRPFQGLEEANGASGSAQIRADGRYIVIQSGASNLVTGDTNFSDDIFLVDTRLPYSQAMKEGRYVEMQLGVGAASSVSISWGDGASDNAAPANGTVGFQHAYGSTGVKAAAVSVHEGDQTWVVPYVINLANGSMVRNTSLYDTCSGGAGADRISGDGFANILIGNGGNDTLDGSAGGDILQGGAGDDVYVVDSIADQVIEAAADGAADLVQSGISYTLGAFVENLVGTGSASIRLAGNASRNTIAGNVGNNTLAGGSGNDVLTGGAGKDVFVFDTKLGTYKTNKTLNLDTITDFNVKDDGVWLDNAVFKKLGKGSLTKPGKLNKDFFTIGTKAQDKNDYLIYNKKTGVLSYDADGSGAGKAVDFLKLSKNLKLTEKDFFIV